jgi:hypothetical protein
MCRANLAKHQAKVGQLREELDKEEMYVEYLEKLLSDIELHRYSKVGQLDKEEMYVEYPVPGETALRY